MRKTLIGLWTILIITVILTSSTPAGGTLTWTEEEVAWLKTHQGQTFHMGLDPYAGMEYFEVDGQQKGYLKEIIRLFEEDLNITIDLVDDQSWGQVYEGLSKGEIDILFGANPTPERLEFMAFTQPVYSVPYVIMAAKNSHVQTVSDLDKQAVGFIENDIAIELFESAYKNITFDIITFNDQQEGLMALNQGQISGLITSGGDVVYQYLFEYPNLKKILDVETIRSEMTFSTLLDQAVLTQLLSKVIRQEGEKIDKIITRSRQDYVREVLQLTADEKAWLANHLPIRIGVPTDYVPVDYFDQGDYSGVAGHFFTSFVSLLGIEYEVVSGTFDELYQDMLAHRIDMLNMAKTEDRKALFLFTAPFSTDRDKIYGSREVPYAHDIYGLEGKRVAVVKGYWHEEYLLKNLQNVTLVPTNDIAESLQKVERGQADYLIELPLVANYYMSGLGYNKIIEKGETSSDAYLYFGAQVELAPLVSIFDKSLVLLDYQTSKYEGVRNLPTLKNLSSLRLRNIIILISFVLLVVLWMGYLVIRRMTLMNAEVVYLKDRERLMYTDALTGLKNRLHFNHVETTWELKPMPQALVMIDLNKLKAINDSYGHLAGDKLIQQFADTLNQFSDLGDVIRMGGDEFVLFMAGVTETSVQAVIQRIRLKLKNSTVLNGEEVIAKSISAAMGYSMRYDPSTSVETMLIYADEMMYADKIKIKKMKQMSRRGDPYVDTME